MSNTSMYDATPWKALQCNKLVVPVSGSALHHPLCPLHRFTIVLSSRWTQCFGCLLCHPLQVKGCQIIAQCLSTPQAVQSV